MDNSSLDSSGPAAPPDHRTPPDQILNNLIIDEAPRAPREPRERDPPGQQDVVAQQTEILAGMLAKLRARQAQPAAPVVNNAEPPADPNFDWSRLELPAETNFQVPGDGHGQVQRMASFYVLDLVKIDLGSVRSLSYRDHTFTLTQSKLCLSICLSKRTSLDSLAHSQMQRPVDVFFARK